MATDWQAPTELPDLRRADIIAVDTETKDEGLIADRGSAWPWRGGYVCGISVAWRDDSGRQVIVRQYEGVLRPDVELIFDDPELAGCTVGDVLADPERFADETLADPLEGIDYGVCKAKIMRLADGTPWIHSFAHGRTIYELKHDATSVRKAIEEVAKEDVVTTFVRLAVGADLDEVELAELRPL